MTNKEKNTIVFSMLVLFMLFLPFSFLTSPCFAQQKEAAARDQPVNSPANSKVTFNFVDVDITTITKFISEITRKNFIFDEKVKGKITIIAPSKLNIEDAYNLFTSVLELKGFTVVPSGVDAYKIIPSSEAKQRGVEVSRTKQPVNESYIARLIVLKHISSEDALKFIQPIVSRDGYVSSFGPGNLLLMIDSGLNIEKTLSILDSIDQPSMREGPEIVFLKYSSADSIAKTLNEGMKKSRGLQQSAAAVAEDVKAIADTRLNAVILFGDKGARESMKSLIALLEIPSPEAHGRINVYFLENADASELAKVMDGILKSSQTQRQATPGAAPVTAFEAAGGITITADKASNALIIVAAPSDYQNLASVIKQLDKRRKQVYVEAMIIEASVEKLKTLGAKWRLMGTHNGEPYSIGGFGTINATSIQSVLNGIEGASLGGLGNFLSVPLTSTASDGTVTTSTLSVPGLAALFSLKEFKDTINILSTPQILTSDNKEAEIVVGENVPFISKRERDSTSSTTVLNSIERKDVGITLKLTPQITEGDYVKLDIYQEISSVKNATDNIIINVGPTTTKRSTKTSVVVKDKETVVIGGLMQERDEINLTKIPFIGDIPLIGRLFKDKSTSRTKTNLLVFLTPNIIKDSDRLTRITTDKQKEFKESGNGAH